MKTAAILVASVACALCAGSVWLFVKTLQFYSGSGYAPNSAAAPSYSAGGVEADGNAIFLPAGLLMVVGLFLAKFAWNLWRDWR